MAIGRDVIVIEQNVRDVPSADGRWGKKGGTQPGPF
jgi:hypothetical protein